MSNSQRILDMCRVCMCKNEIFHSLSDGAADKPLRIYEMLATTLPQVPIDCNDELSQKICIACLNALIIVYKFQQMCIASDTYMRSLLVSNRLASHSSIANTTEKQNEIRHSEIPQETEIFDNLHVTQEPLLSPCSINVETNAMSASDLLQPAGECRVNDGLDSEWNDVDDITLREPRNRYLNPPVADKFHNYMNYIGDDVQVKKSNLSAMLIPQSLDSKTVILETKDARCDNDISIDLCANNDINIDLHADNNSAKASEELEFQSDHSAWKENSKAKVSTVYKEHIVQSESNPKRKHNFRCTLCNAAFDSQYKLKRHAPVHLETNKFVCQICNYRYKTIYGLASHKHIHETYPPGGHKCPKCPKCPKCHGLEKSAVCDSCNKEDRPHISCDICRSTFLNVNALKRHTQTHTSERHKCGKCDKTFARMYHMKRHERYVHASDKPYICNYCGKAFALNCERNKHTHEHIGYKAYICEECPEMFKYQKELLEHQAFHYRRTQKTSNGTNSSEKGANNLK